MHLFQYVIVSIVRVGHNLRLIINESKTDNKEGLLITDIVKKETFI